MAYSLLPWIKRDLLCITRPTLKTSYEGEVVQILQWDDQRDVQSEQNLKGNVSDGDISITLYIPHHVATEMERENHLGRITERTNLYGLMVLKEYSVEVTVDQLCLVARQATWLSSDISETIKRPKQCQNDLQIADWLVTMMEPAQSILAQSTLSFEDESHPQVEDPGLLERMFEIFKFKKIDAEKEYALVKDLFDKIPFGDTRGALDPNINLAQPPKSVAQKRIAQTAPRASFLDCTEQHSFGLEQDLLFEVTDDEPSPKNPTPDVSPPGFGNSSISRAQTSPLRTEDASCSAVVFSNSSPVVVVATSETEGDTTSIKYRSPTPLHWPTSPIRPIDPLQGHVSDNESLPDKGGEYLEYKPSAKENQSLRSSSPISLPKLEPKIKKASPAVPECMASSPTDYPAVVVRRRKGTVIGMRQSLGRTVQRGRVLVPNSNPSFSSQGASQPPPSHQNEYTTSLRGMAKVPRTRQREDSKDSGLEVSIPTDQNIMTAPIETRFGNAVATSSSPAIPLALSFSRVYQNSGNGRVFKPILKRGIRENKVFRTVWGDDSSSASGQEKLDVFQPPRRPYPRSRSPAEPQPANTSFGPRQHGHVPRASTSREVSPGLLMQNKSLALAPGGKHRVSLPFDAKTTDGNQMKMNSGEYPSSTAAFRRQKIDSAGRHRAPEIETKLQRIVIEHPRSTLSGLMITPHRHENGSKQKSDRPLIDRDRIPSVILKRKRSLLSSRGASGISPADSFPPIVNSVAFDHDTPSFRPEKRPRISAVSQSRTDYVVAHRNVLPQVPYPSGSTFNPRSEARHRLSMQAAHDAASHFRPEPRPGYLTGAQCLAILDSLR